MTMNALPPQYVIMRVADGVVDGGLVLPRMRASADIEYEGEWACADTPSGSGFFKCLCQPHGHGRIYIDDVLIYEGGFAFGKLDGEGTLYDDEGDSVRYIGGFSNGGREGYGRYYEDSGAWYEGAFANNKRNGKGTQHFECGSSYRGGWVEDERDGYGEQLANSSGRASQYLGHWRKDEQHGEGFMIDTKTGNWYAGGFDDGKWSGHGVNYNCVTGGRYTGEFAAGVPQGQGAMQFDDKRYTLHGRFEAGLLVYVDMRFANGVRYVGDMLDNKFHGEGRYEGLLYTYEGSYVKHQKHGSGFQQLPTGESYRGGWRFDMREGNGTRISERGEEWTGPWVNGVEHGEGVGRDYDGATVTVTYQDGDPTSAQQAGPSSPLAMLEDLSEEDFLRSGEAWLREMEERD